MLRTYLPCPKMFSGLNVRAKSEPRLPDSRSVLQSPCNDTSYKKDRTPGWLSHCYWGVSDIAPLAKSSRAPGVVILLLPPNVTTTPPQEKQQLQRTSHMDFFILLTEFLSVASWKECNRSTSSPARMPLREKLTAGFSSFLLQTQKEWGNVFGGEKENPSAWYVCPCESVWKPWSSSSAQKLYLCVPVFGTEGTPRLELAERRLCSCQDLDLMAFWAQLLERLGTVPRRMCHPPTAWAVTGDGWCLELREAHSNIFSCHWKLVSLYPGVPCLSLASPLLSVPSSSSRLLVSEQTALCFWPIIFLRMKLRNVSETRGVLQAGLPEPLPCIQPSCPV